MANELIHSSAGTTLTQAEFEAIGLHVCNSQATGDLIYASSATQLSRLGIGAADTVFTCNGAIPAWSATPILNTAVAKGTWTASGTWTIPAVTLGGTLTVTGQVLDAGSGNATITCSGASGGLTIANTYAGADGVRLILASDSASPADADYIGIENRFNNSVGTWKKFHRFSFTAATVLSGSESGTLTYFQMDAGTENECLRISGAGVLSVDLGGSGAAAQVDLFDAYDDALILRQGIQQNNRALLADIGVLTQKDTGSGYMMNLQPMVRLLAGGIYQTRQMLEDVREELIDRLALVEQKLLGD